MDAIIQQLGCLPEPLVPVYRTKIVDGNHLRRTHRQIGELRKRNVVPLPGKNLVVLDPQLRLAIDVLLRRQARTGTIAVGKAAEDGGTT